MINFTVIKRLVILVLHISFLNACAISNPDIVSPSKIPSTSNHGFAVLSVTMNGATDGWIWYQKKGSDDGKRIAAVGSTFISIDDDFPRDKKQDGRLHVLALEPGAYQITGWMGYYFVGGSYYYYIHPRDPAPIDFTIKPNQTIYLGNYHIQTLFEKNFLGIKTPAGARGYINNYHERDRSLFNQRYPSLVSMIQTPFKIDKTLWEDLVIIKTN